MSSFDGSLCCYGLLYSPMSGLSLRTLRSEDRCSHLVIIEQLLMLSFISILSHWTDGVSDGLYCMIMTQLLYGVMVIITLILIFVTCINMWCHDQAVIIIWTWMYLYLCIGVPTLTLKFLIYTHWFYPP